MTIQLRLDSAAIEKLFPEGSTARVDLQQAVIAEFVRKTVKPYALGSDIELRISRARSEAIREVDDAIKSCYAKEVERAGLTLTKEWSPQLSSETRAMIRNAAFTEVRQTITDSIDEKIKETMNRINGTIERNCQVAVNNAIKEQSIKSVTERLNEIVKQLGAPNAS